MYNKRKYGNTNVAPDMLLADMTSLNFEMRTRYDRTLTALASAFAPQDLFLGLYEKLADIGQLQSLSSFCGVALRPELTEHKVHVSPKVAMLDRDVMKAIASHYKDVYACVARKIPEAEAVWPGFKYL